MAYRVAATRAVRAYSTKVSALPFDDLKVSKLANGVIVASQETNSPLATIAVVVNAGPRHECAQTVGAAAYLKGLAFQSTNDFSAFAMTREAEAIGAKLTVQAFRDSIAYVATVPRLHQEAAAKLIAAAATKQLFHPWEIREQDELIEADLHAHQDNATFATLDAAHQLAFRKNLGRSILLPSHKVGHVSADALKAFYEKRLVAGQVSVVGTGITHSSVLASFEPLLNHLSTKSVTSEAAKFYGGAQESRNDQGGDCATATLAFNGPSWGSQDFAAARLLSLIFANTAAVQSGSSTSKIGSALSKAGLEGTATSFTRGYADAGLFGVTVQASAGNAHQVIKTAAAAVKDTLKNGVSEADLARAKNQLSTQLLDSNNAARTHSLILQVTRTGTALSAEAITDLVQAVSLSQLNEVVKKVAASKAVYAVQGNLENVPYLDELSL